MTATSKQQKSYAFLKWPIIVLTTLILLALMMVLYVYLIIAPNLPPLDAITDYRPKLPLRIYTSDKILIGEFGAEHRDFVPIKQIPDILKKALLAIEDDRFYEHGGVDMIGVLRAALADLRGGMSQGASTITMQVARNFFLSREKTYLRKLYEVMLAMKIEEALSKDQILELYMNQIYLGERAYGFSSAANVYFNKKINDLTIAEAAMLAGLPKAPSAYNPIANPQRARQRQRYILLRMRDRGYITLAQYNQAVHENTLTAKTHDRADIATHAEYVAEQVRQILYTEFKESTYTRGLSVYTTITKHDQDAAYAAVRQGAIDYDHRHGYRGPEGAISLPQDVEAREQAVVDVLAKYPDSDNLQSAIVLAVASHAIRAELSSGEVIDIHGNGLKLTTTARYLKTPSNGKIKPGSVIRVERNANGLWAITQLPEVQAAFVAVDSQNGAVRAMVGGFDFNQNKFDHVNQAWRQPGSSFKPFIYSAALERGFSPGTVINDVPLFIDKKETGSQDWQPKNDDNEYDGPITMRTALSKSKNVVSVRILRALGPRYVQDYIARFGFEAARHPAHLSMALGTGAVTPLQMAGAYAVFANGGYRINPYLIGKVVDVRGKILFESHPIIAGQESERVIDARNAYIMDSMLKTVTRSGTGYMASKELGRMDLAGKTGTTSDAIDGWFDGYGAGIVGIAWMGYDAPKTLGHHEFGATLALPIWINFMKSALKGKPEVYRPAPEGVSLIGDWIYDEYVSSGGVATIGFENVPESTDSEDNILAPVKNNLEQEKQRILDLFRSDK